MNKADVLKNIDAALTFIGQAQEAAAPQSNLWRELGAKFEELDSLLESVREGDYD